MVPSAVCSWDPGQVGCHGEGRSAGFSLLSRLSLSSLYFPLSLSRASRLSLSLSLSPFLPHYLFITACLPSCSSPLGRVKTQLPVPFFEIPPLTSPLPTLTHTHTHTHGRTHAPMLRHFVRVIAVRLRECLYLLRVPTGARRTKVQ